MLTLVASAARTVSGNSGALSPTPVPNPDLIRSARFVLKLTNAATDANDTLDVYVQQSYDGTSFDDVVHFTQILGTGADAQTFIAEWTRDVTPESEMHAAQDAAIAAGVIQGMKLGFPLRVKWVIVDPTGSNATFTFEVGAEFEYRR